MYKPMVMARKNCSEWSQVDSAMDRGEAATTCKKYGGCEYMDICLGKVTVEEYKARFEESDLESKKESQKDILDKLLNNKGDKKMSGFLDKRKKEAAEAKKERAINVGTEVAVKIAPWAFAACPVCSRIKEGTRGINKDKEGCNICVMNSNALKEAGEDQAVIDDYDVVVSDKGVVTWELKGEVAAEAEVLDKEPVVKEVVESKAGDEFGPQDVVKEEAPSEEVEAPQEENKDAEFDNSRASLNMEQTGSKGFIISYAPARSRTKKSKKLGEGNCVVHIAELTEMVQGKLLALANAGGAAAREFSDIDYFVRRDLIHKNAKAIAEVVGNSVIDASCMAEASMEQIVATAIERYASFVFGSMK